jgi:hypothetical protein
MPNNLKPDKHWVPGFNKNFSRAKHPETPPEKKPKLSSFPTLTFWIIEKTGCYPSNHVAS